MTEQRRSVVEMLTSHFFRRFFDNDTVQVEGDTLTTVVRAIAALAVPGLMVAFFLQNQYPSRSSWGAIQDQAFFVVFSFVVMATVTVLEWEMLFPDRIDFLVLSPLPLQPVQKLASKAVALVGFILLFLVGANVLGCLVYTIVCKGPFWRQIYAHATAVSLAGVFAAMGVLALNGVLRCVLDSPRFRAVSPVVQTVLVTVQASLLLVYLRYGDSLPAFLSRRPEAARWIPPLWFLAVYDRLLFGAQAPPFVAELAGYAGWATATAVIVVLVTYPLAWVRMRRAVIEGEARAPRRSSRWRSKLVHRLIQRPEERAVFHFIGQTVRRNTRYQTFLALYCGAGLALSLVIGSSLREGQGSLRLEVSDKGLHAVLPLLLFWVVAGLRSAFALPMYLPARWVFRVAGGDARGCGAAARSWAMACALGVAASVLVTLRVAGWDLRHLAVQAVCGICLSVLLTDGFFFRHMVPFTEPRLPGRVNFPLMLTLYVGVLGPFLHAMIYAEQHMERRLSEMLVFSGITLAVHALVVHLRRGPVEVEEEMEGYEGDFQLLGLG